MSRHIINFIPKLESKAHKGSCGRIAVIGGSMEYTGAPYFAAIAALKVGADLVHVFCAREAAPVIKSYSPELIVHPLLDKENAVDEILPWLSRMHALVVGPGMGRDTQVLSTVKELIDRNKSGKIPIVIDADGLHLLNIYPNLLDGLTTPVILTPNKVESERLKKLFPNVQDSLSLAGHLKVILLEKGEKDIIYNGIKNILVSDILPGVECGSPRRCGGQGDVLAGSLAVFAAWQSWQALHESIGYGLSAYAASELTKRCSAYAFQKYGRSMMASNLLEFIQQAFEETFGK